MKDYKAILDEKLEARLDEKFKRVVRAGKIVRKQVARKGFKIVRSKGGKLKQKRMTVAEKRTRKIASTRAWKKNKSSRMTRVVRKRKISMMRRKALMGGR